MSFVSSSSQPSHKTVQELHLSDVCIEKPPALTETCPVETTTERLPHIQEKPRRKKQVKESKKSSEPEEYWLKPGISLPKLLPVEVSRPVRSREPVQFNPVTLFKAADPSADESPKRTASTPNCDRYLQPAETDESATTCPEAVGPSASQSVFRVPSSELNFGMFKEGDEKMEESHALRRWEYWLQEHKKMQKQLSKRLYRRNCELLLQGTHHYRTIVEDKSLFFLAQIPAADKWRGHPFFWKFPNKIRSVENVLRDKDSVPACYEAQTKLEKGEEIPEMEFIGIPAAVRKEKNLTCGTNIVNKFWERLEYRQDRIRDIRRDTQNLKPHDIQMDGLEIVGTKIPKKQRDQIAEPSEMYNLPQIKVSPDAYGDTCPRDYYPERSSVFWLSVGGKELEYDIENQYCQKPPESKVDLTWEIDFGVSAIGALVERTLRVENKGTMAVHYNFLGQKFDEKLNLNSLQFKQHEPCFFFNKNTGIFLPGQIYYLKFYHCAKRSGVRKEIWNLKTQPSLSKNGQNGTIVLSAVSTGDSSDSAIKSLESYLKKRVTQSTVSFILQVLIKKALNPLEKLEGIHYRSFFLEKDLFEYQNPKHYYHSVIVKELHRIVKQIFCEKQMEWDLSIASLCELTLMYVKGKEQDSFLREISQKAKKLLRPNYLLIKNIKKYRMTHQILCKMADFVDADYNQIKNCFVQRKEPSKRTSSQFEEMDGESSTKLEEKETAGESWGSISKVLLEIKPTDGLFFQTMFYLKVYHRVSEAVDQVAGALETSKLTEPWKKIDPNLTKPSRSERE